jgi:spore maturation protein CgeB
MGACLVTDWKENLADLFEPGKEVVAYRSTEECLDLLCYFSKHDAERGKIAAAGQARCHGEHNYEKRMQELLTLLDRAFD